MKIKTPLLVLLFFITSHIFGQNEISINLTRANYKSKDSKLSIDISIKNTRLLNFESCNANC